MSYADGPTWVKSSYFDSGNDCVELPTGATAARPSGTARFPPG
ncbi:DUF397 domain-containing protein [Streptomyces fradiae]